MLYKHFVDDGGKNTGNTINAHFVDLYLGMFFFTSRCCEYCVTREPGKTTRVTVGDITFRDKRKTVITVDNEDDLKKAKYVTVRFREQKNGTKSECRTQGITGDKILDPVIRLGYAVLRIKRRVKDWDPDTQLCTIGEVANRLRITEEIALQTIRDVCRIYGGKSVLGSTPRRLEINR